MELREIPAFAEGKPVAFVYREPNHQPCFQIRQKEGVNPGGTKDINLFRKLIGKLINQLIFLTEQEAAELEIEIGNPDAIRAFTQAEQDELMAA